METLSADLLFFLSSLKSDIRGCFKHCGYKVASA